MSWEPSQVAPDAGQLGTFTFEDQLKRHLAQKDAVIVSRELLMNLALGRHEAQRAAEALLMHTKRH
jgi:hypothetical protein